MNLADPSGALCLPLFLEAILIRGMLFIMVSLTIVWMQKDGRILPRRVHRRPLLDPSPPKKKDNNNNGGGVDDTPHIRKILRYFTANILVHA